MKQEDIQKALEALAKGGINVAGDLVLEKNVNYEVANVEAGGVGIQVNNYGTGKDNHDEPTTETNDEEKKEENPAKCFVERVKQVMLKAEDDNGEEKSSTARGNGGTYIHNVRGKEFCLVMDELLDKHEQVINNYLEGVTAKKAVSLKYVAPFIGFVFDTHEYTEKNMAKKDFDEAFKFYYGPKTSAVSKMSNRHPSEEAQNLFEIVREIMKRHPKKH